MARGLFRSLRRQVAPRPSTDAGETGSEQPEARGAAEAAEAAEEPGPPDAPDAGPGASTTEGGDDRVLDVLTVRRRFATRLTGHGVEIGPGHSPFPVPAEASVRYIDRWEPGENSALFPELGDHPGFPKPDIVSNLDIDRLSMLPDASEDFVVASHILEHLANPLAILADIHRVLKPDGVLVLILPNRHVTFDSERAPTTVDHLAAEYRRDAREVDDDHVIESIVSQVRFNGDQRDPSVLATERTAEEIDLHRRRSIHAHVWNMEEFQQVLDYADRELGLAWEVIDDMPAGAPGTFGNEFGWLLLRR